MQQFLLTSQSTTQRFIFSFVSIIRKNEASSTRRKERGYASLVPLVCERALAEEEALDDFLGRDGA